MLLFWQEDFQMVVTNKIRVPWWGNYPAAISQNEIDFLMDSDISVCVSSAPIGDEMDEWEEDEEDDE
jgi:hypothetical protein